MKFTLEIELGNEAVQTLGEVKLAIIDSFDRIVRSHITDLRSNESAGIRDLNGNTVGKWQVSA